MHTRSLIALVALIVVAVSVHAADKEKKEAKGDRPVVARGTVVGKSICAKCEFDATPKCSTGLQLGEKQFVLVSGKVGEDLFESRCSGKLLRISGTLSLEDGVLTVTGKKSTEVKNQKGKPRLTLNGSLVCTKCEFKVGEGCGVGLKAGKLQIALDGKAAEALFDDRCSGKPKVATGLLTKIEGDLILLTASKIVDPKSRGGNQKKTDAAKPKKDS